MTIIKRIVRGVAVLALFAGAMALVLAGDRIWAGGHSGGEASDIKADLLSRPITPMLGGEGSVDATGPRAFRSILANADNSQLQVYLFGQRIFDAVWDHEPMISPVLDGLGPMFNGTSCRDCHAGNGRGFPPE
ncbi:MAG: di-heme oxidoredictase family protein, partial [Gammaproteobacteria bacterium]|nr:di-heme oxidoredictase family protein [Gammaproteobacteria bacterium]